MPRHHHYNEPLSSGQEEAFLPSGGLSNKDKIFMTRRKERRGKKEKGFSDADRGYYLMWASGLVNTVQFHRSLCHNLQCLETG